MRSKDSVKLQKRFFDKKKFRYDINKVFNPPIHTRLETDKIISHIPKDPGCIVDFGAGNGRLTIPLLRKGFEVIAIDISKNSLDELRENAGKFGFNVKTYTNLKNVSKVNAIVGCDILHHLDKDFNFTDLRKKIKEDGVVIFSEPNPLNPVWYPYIFLKGLWKVEKKIIYCNQHTLRKRLYTHGFKDIKIIGMGLFPRAIFKNQFLCKFNDRLGNLPLVKLFAYRIIIVATI